MERIAVLKDELREIEDNQERRLAQLAAIAQYIPFFIVLGLIMLISVGVYLGCSVFTMFILTFMYLSSLLTIDISVESNHKKDVLKGK